MYSVDTATGRRCTRHNVDYERGEVCHRCVTDPAEPPSGHVGDPEYQQNLRARINEYQGNHKFCIRQCRDLVTDGTARDGNLAVKWSSEAVKWARLAEEQQLILDRREHNLDLIRHEERMSGVRKKN